MDYELCPVGAHYMHGKVERKIKLVKESFSKELHKNRLSIIQWETLGDRIANTINNLPISLGNDVRKFPPSFNSFSFVRLPIHAGNSFKALR